MCDSRKPRSAVTVIWVSPAMGPTADGDDAICGSRIDGEGPPDAGGPSNVTGARTGQQPWRLA